MQNIEDVRRIQALYCGEFEDNALHGKAGAHRRRQGKSNKGARLINGVRQKIDREKCAIAGDLQVRRQFDRLDAAGLIEGVAIVLGRFTDHQRRRDQALSREPVRRGGVCSVWLNLKSWAGGGIESLRTGLNSFDGGR